MAAAKPASTRLAVTAALSQREQLAGGRCVGHCAASLKTGVAPSKRLPQDAEAEVAAEADVDLQIEQDADDISEDAASGDAIVRTI